ncbi:hypothetical protein [Neolewinella agarilytica]|uniref:Uncharacterized protein n=1 Tax=Neolewinella agarilytica TaxID=478744 RepID=A0A1H9ADI8_9BACT|nr:hypothetical protein [Neolewinella agarilytica]SEP74796.1 hypothetical protein SAMN05444359_10259 [Neolewinella agarilytica]
MNKQLVIRICLFLICLWGLVELFYFDNGTMAAFLGLVSTLGTMVFRKELTT